ncbi:hypothetical protein QZH41_008843, partial [Actinostola sp. cb2023]
MIPVGYDATRVEVIPFGNSAYRYIKFISEPGLAKHKCYFNERFNSLTSQAGMTNMRDAFQIAVDVCLGKWQGVKRSPMSQYKTVVILLTNGHWSSPSGDPSPVSRAQMLIQNDAEVFAIGVGSGVQFHNLQRLVANQKNHKTYAFHLKDFSDFNRLATYIRGDPYQSTWQTANVDRSKCSNKCHAKAKCACGLVFGYYRCACPAGMAGSGTNEGCRLCPHGTYKQRQGYAKTCDKCPKNSSHKMTGSISYKDCKCNPGYYGQPDYLQPCHPLSCPIPTAPLNGFIVGGSCDNTFGSTCSYGCKEGYVTTDHTSPVLICPKDQTLPNDKGKNTATVNWNFDFDDNSLKAGAPGISKDKFTVVIM